MRGDEERAENGHERRGPPPTEPEDGWTDLEGIFPVGTGSPFLSRTGGDDRMRVRLFRRDADNRVLGQAWFGPGAEGPPGHAHGGSIMAVLDEAMGAACWVAGHMVVAARLSTDFRNMVPLDTDARVEAWVAEVRGRKVVGEGRLTTAEGTVLAEGQGLFIVLPPAKLDHLAELWRSRFVPDSET